MNNKIKDIVLGVISIASVLFAIGFKDIWNYATENTGVLFTTCAAVLAGVLLYRLGERLEPIRQLANRHGFSTYILAILPLTALAVWYTFWTLPELSGWAAGLLNVSLWVVCYALYDKFPASEVDFYEEIRLGNIAAAIHSSIVCIVIALLILAALYV